VSAARLHEWIERGVWEQALALLVAELDRQGRGDWTRVVVDASIVDAKGGDLVGPSPVNRGFPASKYHLAVDGAGWPLEVRLGPGNENERAHLLPLIDALRTAGYQLAEVWADRGYCSDPLRTALQERKIAPWISRRRRACEPLRAGQRSRQGTRGRQRVTRSSDPLAHHRWVVERTNARLRRFRRLTIRTEPNSRVYLAYLTLASSSSSDGHWVQFLAPERVPAARVGSASGASGQVKSGSRRQVGTSIASRITPRSVAVSK
jgi:transposase